jgi:hypothetical protein
MKGMQLFSRSIFFIFLFLLSAPSFAQTLYRLPADTLELKEKQLDFYVRSFTKSEGIDDQGEVVELVDDDAYSKIDGGGTFRYGFSRNLELRTGLNIRRVSSTLNGETATNQGVESVWVGTKYAFKQAARSNFRFAVDLSFRHTVFSNTVYDTTNPPSDEIVLGDEGNEIRVGVIASHLWTRNFFISGSAYYVKPAGENQSAEMAFNVEAAYSQKNWSLIGGVDMIKSLGQDEYEGAAALKPRIATGASYEANSINREMMAPYGAIEYAFSDSWKVTGKLAQVMSGTSIDKGTELSFNITWNSKGVTASEQKVSRFKEYHIEATVIKLSPRGKFIKIDKGVSHDVEKGMRFDIFQTDFFGGNVLVASGVAYEVGADATIIRLEKRYNNIEIKNGFSARAQ